MAQPIQGRAAVREIRRLLAEVLRGSGDVRKHVADIVNLLDSVEDELTPRGPSATRRTTPLRYTVDKLQGGEVLTEHRPQGRSQPFRVSKSLYQLAAKILSSAHQPLKFEEIMAQVAAKSLAPLGDHQIRTLLRFWLGTDPPLIARSLSRYTPSSPKTLVRDAEQAWNEIVQQGK